MAGSFRSFSLLIAVFVVQAYLDERALGHPLERTGHDHAASARTVEERIDAPEVAIGNHAPGLDRDAHVSVRPTAELILRASGQRDAAVWPRARAPAERAERRAREELVRAQTVTGLPGSRKTVHAPIRPTPAGLDGRIETPW